MKLRGSNRHLLTGVYALNAMTGAQEDKFERHLDSCQPCVHEVRGLHETVSELALAATAPPPPRLRDRVLAAVPLTEQLPAARQSPRSKAPALAPDLAPGTAPARPRSASHRRPARRASWLPPFVIGLAGAATAVALVLGIILISAERQLTATRSAQRQLTAARAEQQALVQMLNTPGVRVLAAKTSIGGAVTAVIVPGQARTIVLTKDLPDLPAGKVYQVWLLGPPAIRSAGLLARQPAGGTATLLAFGVARGDRLGITVEPSGGTVQPTTQPIVDIPLVR